MPTYIENTLKLVVTVVVTLAVIFAIFAIANALGGKISLLQSWRQWLAFVSRTDLVAVIALTLLANYVVNEHWPFE